MDAYDLLVIGGGINGCGIAADAAGRGLRVLLCEQDDLAAHTSSWSSKLIHGGLRYLERYEFKLVRKALKEREVLMRNAPHLIHPLRFLLPYETHMRSKWLLRSGLWLYDHLYWQQSLPKATAIKLTENNPLQPHISHGFMYSDCRTDDSRLVVECALLAKQHGADICTQHQVTKLQRDDSKWQIEILDKQQQQSTLITARCIVNAAGPWVDIVNQSARIATHHHIRLVQGGHIVVPKWFDHDHAYILQHRDGRIVFVIPYLRQFALIGTTDTPYKGNPRDSKITNQECQYLIDIVNQYFRHSISADDIIWSFAGVRPLVQDGRAKAQQVTRDFVLELDVQQAPILHVFGGKLTTYRELAAEALNHLGSVFADSKPAWTHAAPLPGGDLARVGVTTMDELTDWVSHEYPWLPATLKQRYLDQYGVRIVDLLSGAQTLDDLGTVTTLHPELYQREYEFLRQQEWACSDEDILWRRTKLGVLNHQANKQHS
jgi:glycerol-3-phosphate dehydrogenase